MNAEPAWLTNWQTQPAPVVTTHYDGPIITRQEAIARGLTRYFTGEPCKRGHVAERSVKHGCVECKVLAGPKRIGRPPGSKNGTGQRNRKAFRQGSTYTEGFDREPSSWAREASSDLRPELRAPASRAEGRLGELPWSIQRARTASVPESRRAEGAHVLPLQTPKYLRDTN